MIASYQVLTTFPALLFLPSNSLCWALTRIFMVIKHRGRTTWFAQRKILYLLILSHALGTLSSQSLGFHISKADNMWPSNCYEDSVKWDLQSSQLKTQPNLPITSVGLSYLKGRKRASLCSPSSSASLKSSFPPFRLAQNRACKKASDWEGCLCPTDPTPRMSLQEPPRSSLQEPFSCNPDTFSSRWQDIPAVCSSSLIYLASLKAKKWHWIQERKKRKGHEIQVCLFKIYLLELLSLKGHFLGLRLFSYKTDR